MFKDNFFKDREFTSRLLRYTLPIALQTLMLASVAAADAFMLGGVEQNYMSAVSLATQIQFVQNLILSGIVGTTAILGAQYWGKKDLKSMDDIFAISIRLCTVFCVIFFVGCYFIPEKLMLLYTDENVLVEIGAKYLKIAAFSYLIVGYTQSHIVMIRVTNHVRTAAYISCLAVIINIILNYFFIYTFNLEAKGAAYATLIARIIELTVALIVSFRPTYLRLKFKSLFQYNKLLSLDFYKCMFPLMGAGLLWGVGFSSYASFMGHLGVDAAAANSVTAVIRDMVCAATDGLANGGGILIGNELGAGNLEKGKLYGIRMAKISFIIGVISGLILLAITPLISPLLKLSDLAHKYLYQMMAVMAFYMIGRSVNTIVINGIFASGGDTMYDMYSLFITMWCIVIPLAALGTYKFHWPVVAVYACTCLDEVGKIPWTMYHFSKYKWVKDLTR